MAFGVDVIPAVNHDLERFCADFHAVRADTCNKSVRQALQFVIAAPNQVYVVGVGSCP